MPVSKAIREKRLFTHRMGSPLARVVEADSGAVRGVPESGMTGVGGGAYQEPRLKNYLAIVVTVAFSFVGVLGDYLLKLASARKNPLHSGWFYVGFAVYASTAFGWVFVMRHLKLATIGVVYSVSMILLLTGIGCVAFREPLNAYEIAGLVMAVASLILLMRFA
jgi:small multidrug resistance pump